MLPEYRQYTSKIKHGYSIDPYPLRLHKLIFLRDLQLQRNRRNATKTVICRYDDRNKGRIRHGLPYKLLTTET